MRISLFLLFACFFQVFAANNYAQTKKLTLSMDKATIAEVLQAIEDQSEFKFFYNNQLIDVTSKVDVAVRKKKIWEVLDNVLPEAGITYRVVGKQIALFQQVPNSGKPVIRQQPVTITGKVTGEDGNTLPGVNILIKGTMQGAITDADGNYTIEVDDPNATLVFSFIGFRSQEIPLSGQTAVDVTLSVEVLSLEEVVAIGYGTSVKKDLTGAVSTVKVSDLKNLPASNPIKALQGRVSGLSITTTSGKPGDDYRVLIRGTQSIQGTNSPIYVVDGIIMSGIQSLNHNNFESVSVLKDASAAAIYGARAANGVILITTKRGRKGQKPTLTYNGYFGVQGHSNMKVDLLNGEDWINLYREAFENAGLLESQYPTDQYIEDTYGYRWDAGLDRYISTPGAVDSDWIDAITQGLGKVQRHDLSLSGGSENSNYFFSASYYDNQGMFIGTAYNKINITFNSDHKIGKLFDFGNTLVVNSDKAEGITDYPGAIWKVPITRIYEEDGGWGIVRNATMEHMHQSPVWRMQNFNPNYSNNTRVLGNMYLTTHILPGLDFTVRGNLSKSFNYSPSFMPAVNLKWNWEGPQVNYIGKRRSESTHWSTDLLLNYEKNFNNTHNIKIMMGYSAEESESEDLTASRTGTPNDEIPFIGAGDPNTQVNDDSFSDWAFLSYFGRFNYSFHDKYLLTATIRMDGTSRLADGNRWGTFPSVSAAWRISNESFMQGVNFINDLKLRASYGSLGNIQSISTYGTVADLSPVNLVINQAPYGGYTMMKATNKDLQWEATDKSDIGIEGTILNNSVYFVFDVFHEITHDLLFNLAVPRSAGFGSTFPNVSGKPTINAGEVKNTGIEVELGWRKHVGDWSFDISGNITHVKNEVIDLAGQDLKTQGLMEGYPISSSSFFGYTSDGLILNEEQKTGQWTASDIGDVHIVDMPTIDDEGNVMEPDGVITPADRGIIGNMYPKFYYGMIGNIGYKGFTLQIQLTGVQGIDKMVRGRAFNYFSGWAKGDVVQLLDRYHPTRNPNGVWPRMDQKNQGRNNEISTFWMDDASYLKNTECESQLQDSG